MNCKNCKVVCDGKEVAILSCSEDGFTLKCTEEGRKMCKKMHDGCC